MNKNNIKKRKVFYLHGFDPRGVRVYHEMYKTEAAKQSLLSGAEVEVGKRKKTQELCYNWDIKYKNSDSDNITETEYNYLAWDDIVRNNWTKSKANLFFNSLFLYVVYIFTGFLRKTLTLARGSITTMYFPIIFLVLVSYVSLKVGFDIAGFFNGKWWGYALGLGAAGIVFNLLLKLEKYINVFWLLRIYRFSFIFDTKWEKESEERAHKFAEIIANEYKKNDADEVLIVAHSVGVFILMLVLDIIFTNNMLGNNESAKKIKILSVGQPVPLGNFLPGRKKFKDRLRRIAEQKNILWLDVSSIVDGACTPVVSPFYSVCDSLSFEFKNISPKFHLMFDKDKYKKFRLDKFNVHFQYLKASDKKVDYDFFEITSGNKSFEENYERL